jgi:multidrug efflux pump subunit AcrA (membrane-fusion protein)
VFKGKIAYVSPALDQTMRTFTVEALVDNADYRLKPGFFAKGVILVRRDDNVLAVAENTVSTLAGVSSVYVISDGKVTQTTVSLGVRQGNLWEVVSGLKGDETLAANRLNELATGVTIREGGGREGGAAPAGGRRGGGRRGQGQGAGSGPGDGSGGGRRGQGGPRGGQQ